MKAIIIKRIETEVKELPDRKPYYREAVYSPLNIMATVGEYATTQVSAEEINYERMRLVNPETREESNYFVKLDDRKLWNDIVAVSDGFINSKIERGIQDFKDEFLKYEIPQIEQSAWKRGVKDCGNRFKALPWYKRLFYSPQTKL